MDIAPHTTAFAIDDHSWLGSRFGTDSALTVTLDLSLFDPTTHYPNGYLPSGMVLGKVTASGLYGPYSGTTDEQESVTETGGPTGGTFTLTYSGQTTAGIAQAATAAQVQSALEALSNIAPGDVVVTGAAGGPWTVTFEGNLADEDITQMTASGASLTGGTSPNIAIATTVAGGADGSSDGREVAAGMLLTLVDVSTGSTKFGAALMVRGDVIVANLPSGHGLDPNAQADLAGRFTFR